MTIRDICCYTSWQLQLGVLYDVARDVSTILKMTGKRVPGDVESTSSGAVDGPTETVESTGGGDLVEPICKQLITTKVFRRSWVYCKWNVHPKKTMQFLSQTVKLGHQKLLFLLVCTSHYSQGWEILLSCYDWWNWVFYKFVQYYLKVQLLVTENTLLVHLITMMVTMTFWQICALKRAK